MMLTTETTRLKDDEHATKKEKVSKKDPKVPCRIRSRRLYNLRNTTNASKPQTATSSSHPAKVGLLLPSTSDIARTHRLICKHPGTSGLTVYRCFVLCHLRLLLLFRGNKVMNFVMAFFVDIYGRG